MAPACPPGPQCFAEETLRTLCLAYKKVEEDQYKEWNQRHQEAKILLENRAQALQQVYEEIEQDLQVSVAQEVRGLQHPGYGTMDLPLVLGLTGSLLSQSIPAHSPSSCWESQPLKTGFRMVFLKLSSVSRKGTSKYGYSQGTSKVGPRVAIDVGERTYRCPKHYTINLSHWSGFSPAPHLVLGKGRWDD